MYAEHEKKKQKEEDQRRQLYSEYLRAVKEDQRGASYVGERSTPSFIKWCRDKGYQLSFSPQSPNESNIDNEVPDDGEY